MKLKTSFLLITLLLVLQGCAPKVHPITRNEWKNITTRTYHGISNEKLFDAAEKIVNNADPEDTKFARFEDGFVADRYWFLFAVIASVHGYNTYNFRIKNLDNNTTQVKLIMSSSIASSSLSPSVTSGGGMGASVNSTGVSSGQTSSNQQNYGNFTYEIFWKRLDYELGLTDKWYSCQQAMEDYERGTLFFLNDTPYDPFCSQATSEALMPNGKSEWAEETAQQTDQFDTDY